MVTYVFFTVPGKIAQPEITFENNTKVRVKWSKPSKPAGPVDYYQIIVVHHSGSNNSEIIPSDSSISPTALAFAQMQEIPNLYWYQRDSKYHCLLHDGI